MENPRIEPVTVVIDYNGQTTFTLARYEQLMLEKVPGTHNCTIYAGETVIFSQLIDYTPTTPVTGYDVVPFGLSFAFLIGLIGICWWLYEKH